MGGVTGIPHRRCEKRTATTATTAAVVPSVVHSTVGAATATAAAAAAPGVAAVAPTVVPGTISSTDATAVTGDDALNAVTACHRPSTRTSTHVVAAYTICAALAEKRFSHNINRFRLDTMVRPQTHRRLQLLRPFHLATMVTAVKMPELRLTG